MLPKSRVSIIIRTLNEQKYLPRLLAAITQQESDLFSPEVVIVDSGSTDDTLQIAAEFGCRIFHIKKSDFTFGRSLNLGCSQASGDIFVIISGHCIPTNNQWLHNLCLPIYNQQADYVYGRQQGLETTKFSESRHFEKWFPKENKLPQDGFFCNNANAAISAKAWALFRFDEALTGLEDLHLAKLLTSAGRKVGYLAAASVYHIHDETWRQVKKRYERESLALQHITPEIRMSAPMAAKLCCLAIASDFRAAMKQGIFFRVASEIILFRSIQYYASYIGNRYSKNISKARMLEYFYPKEVKEVKPSEKKNRRIITNKA